MTLFTKQIEYLNVRNPKDLAPTFAAILNIEPPVANWGYVFDEVMQLNDGSLDEKKTFYYKLRIQKQEMIKKLLSRNYFIYIYF